MKAREDARRHSLWLGAKSRFTPIALAGKNSCFGGSRSRTHSHQWHRLTYRLPRPVHDLLLAEGLAEQHRWVPNSGWITFPHPQRAGTITHALWLMRLSYLRYAPQGKLQTRAGCFEHESEELRLSPRFKSLLEPFVPKNTPAVSASAAPQL